MVGPSAAEAALDGVAAATDGSPGSIGILPAVIGSVELIVCRSRDEGQLPTGGCSRGDQGRVRRAGARGVRA